MRRKSAEKQVMTLMERHTERVEESVRGMVALIRDYLDNKMEAVESLEKKIDTLESEADDIRREIYELLHRGAFLPVFRDDVMQLVIMVDQIAGHALNCGRFLVFQRPFVPPEVGKDLLTIASDSAKILIPLKEAVVNLSADFSITSERITEIHQIESDVDDLEWALVRRVFSYDLDLAHKIHLKQLVDMVTEITDIAEDAAEILETMIVKKQM